MLRELPVWVGQMRSRKLLLVRLEEVGEVLTVEAGNTEECVR